MAKQSSMFTCLKSWQAIEVPVLSPSERNKPDRNSAPLQDGSLVTWESRSDIHLEQENKVRGTFEGLETTTP